jgi:phosphoglycerol transferase MdoB-like AlkP superfamily enzyme
MIKKFKSAAAFRPLIIPFIIISFLTRMVLYGYASYLGQVDIKFINLLYILASGLLNDVVTFIFTFSPMAVFLLIMPPIIRQKAFYNILRFVFTFCWIFGLFFSLVAEFTFWDEFGARFDFIAVDYLVYTHEVIGNVMESYPVWYILGAVFITSIVSIYIYYPKLKQRHSVIFSYKHRIAEAFASIIFFVTVFYSYNPTNLEILENRFENELTKNGLYSLFSAFRNNSLDYDLYYQTMDKEKALAILKDNVKQPGQEYIDQDNFQLTRKTAFTGKLPNKHNVMLIVVESLSKDYMGQLANGKSITPNLDKIRTQSLDFSNFYATGTRTVRGLEAITLSIPPTPGSSIVRRPNNENLFSIGTILKKHNYDQKFIYGGYGYFDNMNYFYENNNFKIVDRSDIPKEAISFENIWGVADEDLFNNALKEGDKSFEQGKPFFSLIMTTSNHRPYTYPEGRIDIPSGKGFRPGGVKYSDYAIGKFIEDAKSKEWFDNTIFIITADHCAASAGKTKIPLNKYHIPLFVYAPNIIKPGVIDKMASQVDLAPTILSFLNIDFESRFFGNDILTKETNPIFVSTYQLLGYLENNEFVILSPRKDPLFYKVKDNKKSLSPEKNDKLLNKAISYYQGASYMFKKGLLKE